MRRAERGDGLETMEAADTVIRMHDKIAHRKARRLREHVGRTLRLAPRTHEAVTENILLGNDDQLRRLKPLLEAEHGKRRDARIERQRVGIAFDLRLRLEPVIGKERREPLRAPFVHAATITRRCEGLHLLDVRHDRIEHVGIRVLPLRRERAPHAPAPRTNALTLRHLERSQPDHFVRLSAFCHAAASRNIMSGGTGL